MIQQFVYFAIAVAISLVLTPLAGRVAYRIGAVDYPGENKIHLGAVPRLGGLAIYLAIAGTLLLALHWDRPVFQLYFQQMRGFYLGGMVILALGIYDDTKGSKAPMKLICQGLAALVLYAHGVRIEVLTNPFGHAVSLGPLSLPLTILWVVALVNAFNLLDGLDGLAAGSACIAAAAIFAVALHDHRVEVAILMVVLAGACAGFLRYNFFPAKIFMGDTGSMFIGFVLATISVMEARKATTALALMIPLAALSLPVLDTFLAIVRRAAKRKNVFRGDREHLHHRLLHLGISQKQAVLLLYYVNVCFAIMAFMMVVVPRQYALLLVVVLVLWLGIGVVALRFVERKVNSLETEHSAARSHLVDVSGSRDDNMAGQRDGGLV